MIGNCSPFEDQIPKSKHDAAYWKTRPIEERFAELEALRQEYIRTLPPEQQKFQRIITFIGSLRDAP
jgi:tetrahydromethanopterin S-methyltransferase subunit B